MHNFLKPRHPAAIALPTNIGNRHPAARPRDPERHFWSLDPADKPQDDEVKDMPAARRALQDSKNPG